MGKIIVANWKMNGSLEFIRTFVPSLAASFASTPNQIMICPPFPYLSAVSTALKGATVQLGAQNCHTDPQGAFTGEVSASMLSDIGCQAVIVGHSERRSLYGETDALARAKASAIHAAGMIALVCVGESRALRESGQAIEAVIQQLHASLPAFATPHNTLVAYEPVWAIGAGLTASEKEIREMHQALRAVTQIPLLYGGSVSEENAADILRLPHVDGVLVGGASLKSGSFQKIIGFH